VPDAAVVAVGIVGFWTVLVKLFGPVHEYVIAPAVTVLDVRFKAFPLHTGPLLTAVGVAGGLGSERVKGPTVLDGQLFSVTLILL
jgi:hypothetical protein